MITPWQMVKCESWPCSDYETSRDMWLYAMELERIIKKVVHGAIIRIRTKRQGGQILELHQQLEAIDGSNKVPYFVGLRCDAMKRQVKQHFHKWVGKK
jgi:hypothetical protein